MGGPFVFPDQSIAQEGVRAIDPRKAAATNGERLQKPMFALPSCQLVSVNACDTFGLAEEYPPARNSPKDPFVLKTLSRWKS